MNRTRETARNIAFELFGQGYRKPHALSSMPMGAGPVDSTQQQLEADIETTREEIARLKQRLTSSFGHASDFVSTGDDLRHATDTLARLEAELKTLKLESRDEVWWRSSRRSAGKGPSSLRRSEQGFRYR